MHFVLCFLPKFWYYDTSLEDNPCLPGTLESVGGGNWGGYKRRGHKRSVPSEHQKTVSCAQLKSEISKRCSISRGRVKASTFFAFDKLEQKVRQVHQIPSFFSKMIYSRAVNFLWPFCDTIQIHYTQFLWRIEGFFSMSTKLTQIILQFLS